MENKIENVDTRETRLVWDARIARRLCKKGLYIVDLKPLKTDREKTVFIFKNTPEFNVALSEIIEDYKQKNKPKIEEVKLTESVN